MARMVATKAALSIRVDALTDADGKSEETAPSIGVENRAKLESRLRALEHQEQGNGVRRFDNGGKKQQRFEMTGETKTYNTNADAVELELVSTQRVSPKEVAEKLVSDVKEEKKRAKEERRAKRRAEREKSEDAEKDDENEMDVDEEESKKEKKEKKRKRRESGENGVAEPEVKVCYLVSFVFSLLIFFSSKGGDRRGTKGKEKG